MAEEILPPNLAALLQGQSPRGVDMAALVRAGLIDQNAPIDYGQPQFTPISAMPTGYNAPGYRPTSGIAAGPQSADEARDLAESARVFNGLIAEPTGLAPVMRAQKAAQEGRPMHAFGHAATAVIPYRPALGLGMLGAGYGATLGQTLMSGFDLPQAEAQQRQQSKSAAKPQTATNAEPLPGLTQQQQVEYEKARKRVTDGDFGSSAERRQLEETMRELRKVSTDFVTARNSLELQSEAEKGKQARGEYARSVEAAERGLAEARARVPRPFKDTPVGSFYEATGGWTPGVVGFGTSALARIIGRPRVESAIEGAAAGALTPNAPMVWDMFSQPSYNPERAAYAAYARDLPNEHPRRDEWAKYADKLPEENPVRRQASSEFYDPLKFAERTTVGGLEGAVGGLAGTNAAQGVRTISEGIRSGLGSMFGRRQGTAGPGGSGTGNNTGGGANPLTLEQRRRDPGYRIDPGAPVGTEAETWVSPAGRNLISKDVNGQWRDESGNFASPPAGRRNWRRISSAEDVEPSSMADFLRMG